MKTHELSLKNTGPRVVTTVCGIEGPFDDDFICAFEVAPTCKTCLKNGRHAPTAVIPTIHLNGSGATNLADQYREAIEAVSEAINKLPVPHGRDYYVQEAGAYEAARNQFNAQVLKLNEVRDQLRTIYRSIRRQERAAS